MAVAMDNVSERSSRERAQQIYNKNAELRRRIPQAKLHVDHNLWCQIRDNYEAIVLEDHDFAEQHDVEFDLWQLHYKRIEELRAQLSALNMNGSATGQNGKGDAARPDRLTKIRSQLKTFLSEATGFYHEFMVNIREKYGLQQSYLPDDHKNQIVVSKDGSKPADIIKGLISCQRCLIYLGDLARYKGLFGDSESKVRDFTAASSYYRQASSLLPSYGNPYHQLAILVSYSGDEFVSIYYYFRSLAVDSPFTTARENLVLAFEKNRLNYAQLVADLKASSAKLINGRVAGRGRGRGEPRFRQKEIKADSSCIKEKAYTIPEKFKAFSVKFVRLNGILFTRTSLETFADVMSMARNDIMELLSSGPQEQCNLGSDPSECGLFVVRLVAMLIFTVFHLNQKQTYADSLQRSVLLQHAYTALFVFMGHIVERCTQLHDPLSSFLLPGFMVFVEWLACHPDITAGKEAEEEQANSRSFFWKKCVLLFNKLLCSGLISLDEDETCFFDMSGYDEGETTNRMALWEDFELRGFLPIRTAHQILDFSGKQPFSGDGGKEIKMRIQRIISAGKACTNVVLIGQQTLYFDSKLKKFSIGFEQQLSSAPVLNEAELPSTDDNSQELPTKKVDPVVSRAGAQLIDGEDEEEVILFKPLVVDKHTELASSFLNPKLPYSVVSTADLGGHLGPVPAAADPILMSPALNPHATVPLSLPNGSHLHAQPTYLSTSSWLLEQPAPIMNGFNKLSLAENGLLMNLKPQGTVGSLQQAALSLPFPGNGHLSRGSMHPARMPLNGVPSRPNTIMPSGNGLETMYQKPTSNMNPVSRKTPVSRPVRQIGPPPGFTAIPAKNCDEPLQGLNFNDGTPIDDYSWLDGYQMPSSTTQGKQFNSSAELSGPGSFATSNSSSMAGNTVFPFPGKQASLSQGQADNYSTWQDSRLSELMNGYSKHPPQQPLRKDNQQGPTLPGQSLWEGRLFV